MNPDKDYRSNIEPLIARYLAGEASPGEIENLLHWIQLSDDNRRLFLRQQDIWMALNPRFDVRDIDKEDSQRRLLDSIGIKTAPKRLSLRRFLNITSRIAAVLLLPLLAFTIYLMSRPGNNQGSIPNSIENIAMTTGYGGLSRTTLPDGTQVWLNANSTLQYPPYFTGENREVILDGEAYFDVQADARHPFNVKTPFLTVTATGTQFNVNAYSHDASVILLEGKVAVNDSNTNVILNPGQQLTIADGKTLVSDYDPEYCSWRDGILRFDRTRLADICRRLNQIYGIEFEISPRLVDRNFHMTLRGESINEILSILEQSAPLTCTLEEIPDPTDSTQTKQKVKIN